MKKSDMAEVRQDVGFIGGRAGPTAIFMSSPGSQTWQEYALSGTVALGWLLPLIVGICLWRRGGMAGRMLVGIGTVWGVLALAFVGWFIWMCFSESSTWTWMKTFDLATYQGAVGTVAFAYDGNGEVLFHHAEPDAEPNKRIVWKTAITNGIATFPAGRITEMMACFFVTDASGKTLGQFSWFCTEKNEMLTLEPGGRHEVAGGFPLMASISVEEGVEDGQCVMQFSMADTAGNRVDFDGGDDSPLDVSFEAIASDGTCFWRGRLEYNFYLGKIPADAPATFIIRPVLGKVPLDIRIEETRVSRDELLRETLERGERWLKEKMK